MKSLIATTMLVLAAGALAGCATAKDAQLYGGVAHPEEVVLASCEAATATLKDRPDHEVAHRACMQAKTRQHVD